jgi:ABC-type branched-subunit amino acid transport system substrate-binding protein
MQLGRLFLWTGRRIKNCSSLSSKTRISCGLFSLAVSLAATSPLFAQTDQPAVKPYATLDRQGVTYRGPLTGAEKELPNGPAVIGMILPLRGPQEAEGKALLTAAQIALEEEQAAAPLPDGRKLILAVRDESGPWGQASSEILKLIEDDHALVLITSANGGTAHQAEQIANKISFPILTLASDPTTTQTNVPWVFRLGPSDADQARAFCRHIAVDPGIRKVLLIAQADHDGRVGGVEFEKVAKEEMKFASLERLEISASSPHVEAANEAIRAKKPDAVVLWTDAVHAKELLSIFRKVAPATPVFLCSKAAQLDTVTPTADYVRIAVASSAAVSAASQNFAKEYEARTGSSPGIAAFETYEAVHLIAAGIRANRANRVLLREYFADANKVRNATGILSFDPAGNSIQEFSLFSLSTQP